MPPDEIFAPPALKSGLRKLGLSRYDDLVLHLPMRYEDETCITPIDAAPWGMPVQVEAAVIEVDVQFRPRRQLVARVRDAGGELVLRFLNFYGSQIKQFESARDDSKKLRLFGEIREGYFGAEMVHPRYRVVSANEALPNALTPVYPTTAGVSQSALRKLILNALANADLAECFDPAWCRTQDFPCFSDAVRLLHAPPPAVDEGRLAAMQAVGQAGHVASGAQTTQHPAGQHAAQRWNCHGKSPLEWRKCSRWMPPRKLPNANAGKQM